MPSKKLFHLRLHRGIHLDERRPGAFEAFAGEFLRRVEAEFAAAGDFTRRVVEHVRQALGEEAVALRNDTAAKALLRWAAEREAWLEAVTNDPLLPGRILPSDYLGQQAWRRRVEVLRDASRQLRTFKPK